MKRRLILNFLTAVLVVLALAPSANAAKEDSGTCGDGLSWTLKDHTLTISGSGEMDDGCPWEAYKDDIEAVVLTGGVTRIGEEAFADCDWIRTVDFGDSLVEIGWRAFYSCKRITTIHLPDTFRTFGAECFRDCENLKKVYCDGGMPKFSDSCLWTGNYVSVFYPATNPWPSSSVQQLVSNFGGQLGIFMGSAETMEESDQVLEIDEEETEAAEETEETVEETVEETTEATTEPETEPTTEPTTVPTEPETEPTQTTVPETEETTVPTTEAAETTEAVKETEAPTVEEVAEQVGSNGWIGLVIVAGVLTLFAAGVLIFRSTSRRGGRYKE